MHEHGPKCLEGPIRGTHAWWRGLEPLEEPPASQPAATPAQPTPKQSPKKEETGIRQELVERIRREISAGTYDTPEKWHSALDSLLGRLDQD